MSLFDYDNDESDYYYDRANVQKSIVLRIKLMMPKSAQKGMLKKLIRKFSIRFGLPVRKLQCLCMCDELPFDEYKEWIKYVLEFFI